MNPQARSLHDDPTRPEHAEPLHAEPAATYRINPPSSSPRRPPAPWPLAARFALGVIIAGLAAGLALSLVTLRSVSATAAHASAVARQDGASVTQLRSQLSAVQSQLASQHPVQLPPALQHYGVCLTTWTNNATGSLSNMTLSPPVVKGNGVYTCSSGIFVSVVPVPGS